MDRRSWPWKKKSSDKIVSTDSSAIPSASSIGNKDNENNSKDSDYVKISKDMHSHFLKLEDQVHFLENQLQTLDNNMSTAQSDLLVKENLVKQHAKVAEEAVSGWEKAEAEALALKNQLESVTLQRLSAEDKAAHLDGALKECMKQIRLIKEESEQQLQDVIFAKSQQWENIRFDLDSRIVDLEQELLQASAENDAISRSLQERSAMLMKISEEKSQSDAEIEILKSSIQSCEKEIGSLKYEVHIVTKELEIRNEEKNMSLRSADAANKQHLEDVKKMAKLDAECQRLRKLVRKRLPGPAALAQMRHEVDGFDRKPGEVKVKVHHPSGKPLGQHFGSTPDSTLESLQQYQKENEFLTVRLLAMEEETKMLKEALSKRNSELQTSRNICAKTSSKLRSLETHMLVMNRQSPSMSNPEVYIDGAMSQNGSNPRSLTSMSEDGIDEQESFGESWSTTLISDKDAVKLEKVDHSNDLELLDDFLEMEKLACLSTESDVMTGGVKSSAEASKEGHLSQSQPRDMVDSSEEVSLSELQARISSMVKTRAKDLDMGKLLQDIKAILHDVQEDVSCTVDDHSSAGITETNVLDRNNPSTIDEMLKNAISEIHNFVLEYCEEAQIIDSDSTCQMSEKMKELSDLIDKVIGCETSCDSFIIALWGVMCEIKECKVEGKETNGPDVCNEPEKQDPSDLCTPPEIEELRREKGALEEELARSNGDLENLNAQLEEMKSKLNASEKSTSLAEIQLKCMTESYKSMEARACELEVEINGMRSKIESLDEELRQERVKRLEEQARYKDLEEQIERNQKCSTSAVASDADADAKDQREKEIAAATEKLAECQETILLLGKQIQSSHPPADVVEDTLESLLDKTANVPGRRSFQKPDPSDRCGGESPLNGYLDTESSPIPRSPINSLRSKHRSSSSSGLSSTPDKHSRGFTRFFSKPKRDADAPSS